MSNTPSTTSKAGVLAHALHAVAHHITEHRLPLLHIDASLTGLADPWSPIAVAVLADDLDLWLPTVHVDETDIKVDGRIRVTRHRARLADTGVVVVVRCTEVLQAEAMSA